MNEIYNPEKHLQSLLSGVVGEKTLQTHLLESGYWDRFTKLSHEDKFTVLSSLSEIGTLAGSELEIHDMIGKSIENFGSSGFESAKSAAVK